MNSHELTATLAALTWSLLWWPVGRSLGWWAGAGAFLLGGFAGLVAGWLFAEWVSRLTPHGGRWGRTAAEAVSVVAGFVAFVGLPLWALSLVRAW